MVQAQQTTSVQIIDKNGRVPAIDELTNGFISISQEHHEIHEGNHYNICNYQRNNSEGDIIEFVITTEDSTKQVHLTFDIYSGDGATIDLYSGTSGVTGGTSITPRNNNNNSSNTSGMTVVKDPTSISSDGTFTEGFLAGAKKETGFAKRENEIVLVPNTTYLVRITSLANSNDISWCAEWYEHTPKNE